MKVVLVQPVKQRPPAPVWDKKKKVSQGFRKVLEDAIRKVK